MDLMKQTKANCATAKQANPHTNLSFSITSSLIADSMRQEPLTNSSITAIREKLFDFQEKIQISKASEESLNNSHEFQQLANFMETFMLNDDHTTSDVKVLFCGGGLSALYAVLCLFESIYEAVRREVRGEIPHECVNVCVQSLDGSSLEMKIALCALSLHTTTRPSQIPTVIERCPCCLCASQCLVDQ